MTRGILALAALALVLAAPAAAKGGAGLRGQVGPGFTIEVKMGNKDVKTLKAGTYTMKVEDKASIHNFHLIGPGVDKSTSVSGTGEQTWTLKLKKGTYKYQCDPHASSMHGSFTVT
jgi:plastocyanin